MLKPFIRIAAIGAGLALAAPAWAQSGSKVGTLSCDVSAGVGMILMQKQRLHCVFRPDNGGPADLYTGQITDYGVAIGEVAAGHLIWGVIAADRGFPMGALAGSYAGVGVQAAAGVGIGANLLVGGTGRAFSLQPLSVEGMTGLNIAGGVTQVTLAAAP
ncbi:DUF992 domain-containing protein [Alsobacter sp. KACC 23698]|uniref:DUF992 domain-containing protein n=1 Tax=Alsobacter sp. KACC 23698 TaxID=3149229 RepID=A0AAU7JEC2_9HYPH